MSDFRFVRFRVDERYQVIYLYRMTNAHRSNRLQTLTRKDGSTLRARVIRHAPAHSLQMTGCGKAFSSLDQPHQTSACGDLSDVSCPECLKIMGGGHVGPYPMMCLSEFCGKGSDSCPTCPYGAANLAFKARREAWNTVKDSK